MENSKKTQGASSSAASAANSDEKIWKFDLNVKSTSIEEPIGFIRSTMLLAKEKQELLTAGGGGNNGEVVTKIDESKLLALKKKRAMDMATAPGKQLFMTMFMLWMAGAGVHIFSIMIVGMSVFNPIKAIGSVQAYFQPLEADGLDLTQAKLTYIALNFVGLGVALYKCFTMGLLPLSSTDWVSLIEPRPITEISGGGISLA